MGDRVFKAIRQQLRNVVKEFLPEVLTQELKTEISGDLAKEIGARLTAIEGDVKKTMEEMNQRSKDVQSYLVRAVTNPAQTDNVVSPTEPEQAKTLEPKAD